MKPHRTLISINRLLVGWFPSEWKNWRVWCDDHGVDFCLGPLGITIVWGEDAMSQLIRVRDRVVKRVPRLQEAGREPAVDLMPRYGRIICVFDEMASVSVCWEDTGEYEVLTRREVKVVA